MSAIADLPDLNVWLALASPAHQHHSSAVSYWEEQAAQQVLFCTVTALGLVRLVMQPKVMLHWQQLKPQLCWRSLCSNLGSAMHNHPTRAGMCSML